MKVLTVELVAELAQCLGIARRGSSRSASPTTRAALNMLDACMNARPVRREPPGGTFVQQVDHGLNGDGEVSALDISFTSTRSMRLREGGHFGTEGC